MAGFRCPAGISSVVIGPHVRGESGRIVAGSRGFEWTQELIDLDAAAFPMVAGLCAYLDTVFNDDWMAAMGLFDARVVDRLASMLR